MKKKQLINVPNDANESKDLRFLRSLTLLSQKTNDDPNRFSILLLNVSCLTTKIYPGTITKGAVQL